MKVARGYSEEWFGWKSTPVALLDRYISSNSTVDTNYNTQHTQKPSNLVTRHLKLLKDRFRYFQVYEWMLRMASCLLFWAAMC